MTNNKLTRSKQRSFYAAVGRFVLTWADLETYLDLLVLKLRAPTQRKVPHQLSGKIIFIRVAIQSVGSVTYVNEVQGILDEIECLADTRHDYIHGSRIGHSVERSVLSITLGRLLQPPNKLRRMPVRITAAEIEKTTDRLYVLGDKLLDILEAVVDQSPVSDRP